MARGDDDAEDGAQRTATVPDGVETIARIALDRLARRDATADLSPAFLKCFCGLLASGDYRAAERILDAMTRGRPGYARIADGILSAAARHLGDRWERDQASFAEVSVAVAQIFRLNQAFGQRNTPWTRRDGRSLAIFATLPGQAHNLGIVLAAEAFRQENWQVQLQLDTPGRSILERVRRMRPEAVGLSVSIHDRQHQLEYLIRELQALPMGLRILLGGAAARELAGRLPRVWRVHVVTDIASALDVAAADQHLD